MGSGDSSDDSGYGSGNPQTGANLPRISREADPKSTGEQSRLGSLSSNDTQESLTFLAPEPIPDGQDDEFGDTGTSTRLSGPDEWKPVDQSWMQGVKEFHRVKPVPDPDRDSYATTATPSRSTFLSRTTSAISSWWSSYGLTGTQASACRERFSSISSSFRSLDSSRQLSYLKIGAMTIAAGAAGASVAYGLTTDRLTSMSLVPDSVMEYVGGKAAVAVSCVAGTAGAALGGMFGKRLFRTTGTGTQTDGAGTVSDGGHEGSSRDGTIPGD